MDFFEFAYITCIKHLTRHSIAECLVSLFLKRVHIKFFSSFDCAGGWSPNTSLDKLSERDRLLDNLAFHGAGLGVVVVGVS